MKYTLAMEEHLENLHPLMSNIAGMAMAEKEASPPATPMNMNMNAAMGHNNTSTPSNSSTWL